MFMFMFALSTVTVTNNYMYFDGILHKLCENLFTISFVVEDPSYDFIRLRDYIDALDCSKLSEFTPENLRNGFSDKMVQQGRKELKINKVFRRKV